MLPGNRAFPGIAENRFILIKLLITGVLVALASAVYGSSRQKTADSPDWERAYHKLEYYTPHYDAPEHNRSITTLYVPLGEWKGQCPRYRESRWCLFILRRRPVIPPFSHFSAPVQPPAVFTLTGAPEII